MIDSTDLYTYRTQVDDDSIQVPMKAPTDTHDTHACVTCAVDLSTRKWLMPVISWAPEARPKLPQTPRKRPLIYVYDLPRE